MTDRFQPFLKQIKCEDADYCVEFCEVEVLPKAEGILSGVENGYDVYMYNELIQYRLFYDLKNNRKPYAVAQLNTEDKKIKICYITEGKRFLSETGNSFFHIGWEKILSCENRIHLHASCANTIKGGILFSGPSGIGKSTQAGLWQRYEGAEILNGDRVILKNSTSGWLAYGSPYAGSSSYYVNKSCLVKAIVILKQASESSIRELTGIEAFRKVYEELTVNSWDENFVCRAVDMTKGLISEVPVYELECAPNNSSIDVLKKKLGW